MSIVVDFAEAVKNEIERRGFEAIIALVVKNNGLVLSGLTIRTADQKRSTDQERSGNASPTFYLDAVPEEHRNLFYVPRIADELISAFHQFEDPGDSVRRVLRMLQESNVDELLNRVMPRLVNYEWNKVMLTTLPHRKYLDLAITYYVDVGEKTTCRISNEIAMGVSEDELYKAATQNAKVRGYNVFPLGEMMKEALEVLPIENPESIPMLVVSNTSFMYGSYALLDEAVLKEIREKVGEFYILPSSVHELIMVPKSGGELESSLDHLKELVRAVNRSNVPREEWLSDSVYEFDGEMRVV